MTRPFATVLYSTVIGAALACIFTGLLVHWAWRGLAWCVGGWWRAATREGAEEPTAKSPAGCFACGRHEACPSYYCPLSCGIKRYYPPDVVEAWASPQWEKVQGPYCASCHCGGNWHYQGCEIGKARGDTHFVVRPKVSA